MQKESASAAAEAGMAGLEGVAHRKEKQNNANGAYEQLVFGPKCRMNAIVLRLTTTPSFSSYHLEFFMLLLMPLSMLLCHFRCQVQV